MQDEQAPEKNATSPTNVSRLKFRFVPKYLQKSRSVYRFVKKPRADLLLAEQFHFVRTPLLADGHRREGCVPVEVCRLDDEANGVLLERLPGRCENCERPVHARHENTNPEDSEQTNTSVSGAFH